MKAYKITATTIDSNGRTISLNNPETLGDAYGVTYLTEDAANQAWDDVDCDTPAGYASCKYSVEDVEIEGLETGEKYDLASLCDVMLPLPDGYHVNDYFKTGRYLGPDCNSVGICFP